MTIAGIVRIPSVFARLEIDWSFISQMVILHEGQASCFTIVMVSSQTGHPALKISI
jgi:hypothetical protein